ncbi:MAG: TIGR03016 family PEP-CTERM system-associated outer membrane protein [Desulfobacteraceae bacterium]|nr:TIGR03016 family PEP-CTERM system-associated outer membrane protein [Desulfobacteraceae bacterium]
MHFIHGVTCGSDCLVPHEGPLAPFFAVLKRWPLCFASVCVLLGVTQVQASDYILKPSLAISEEYTDNVFESVQNKRPEYITRVQPGLSYIYKAPLWDWDLGYVFDYRNYARGSHSDEITHTGNVKGLLKLVDERLNLDLMDSYQRVSLNIARDATQESLFLNQTDQNIATISPYLLWHPGEKTTLKTGYRFIDTRYWGEGIEKQEHVAFANLNHELTSKFSMQADYAFSKTRTTSVNFDRHDLSGGFRYNYADKSFLFGSLGNSWQIFSSGNNVSNLFWSAGITHDLSIFVLTLETRVQFAEDPLSNSTKETSYSGKLDRELKRGAIGLFSSYTEYVITQTGAQDWNRLAFGASGRYEVLPKLTANLEATAERFSQKTAADYPYRFTGTGGLNYAFNHDITLGLTYIYVTNVYDLDNMSAGAKEINRAMVEVKKVF